MSHSEMLNIPSHWKTAKLGESCLIILGQSPPSKTYNKDGVGLPFFQGKKEFTELHPVIEKWCSKPIRTAKTNDILLSVRAPVGATNIADNDCCIGRGLAAIRYEPNYKFAFYYLRSKSNQLNELGTGSTFSAISGINLKSFPIPLPPLPEQQLIVAKIEELFSELDNAVENLKKAKEQLKVYRQAVLKWAFEGKLTEEWRKERESQNAKYQSEKEEVSMAAEEMTNYSLNSKLPFGWKWKKIKDLCEVVRGGSPRPAGDPRFYGGDIPFLKVADLTKDEKIYLNAFEYTIKEEGLKKTRQIEPNTLLLTNSGATLGVPKICLFKTTLNDGIAAFLNLDPKLNRYLYYFWLSNTKQLRNINQGAAQPNLNTEIIKNIEIPISTLKEQDQIVLEIETRFSVADNLEQSINQSLQQAEALRQSILKRAFEGRLVSPLDEKNR